MPPHISVQTLGSVAIDVGRRRLGPSSGRVLALVLYLASRRGHTSSRRVIQELLFPESQNGQAAHNFRQLLYRVRQAGIPLRADADQVAIGGGEISVDWCELLDGDVPAVAALERLSQGVLPGYIPSISASYRDWVEAERAEISLRVSRRLTTQLPQLRASGRWDLVAAVARALLALDPLSEEGTLARAEVLAIAGSKSAALGVIDEYMSELGEDQPHLRLAPAALRRRISERLPDVSQRAADDRLFVGREDMMRMLNAMGTAARCGNQQVLLVWGEPGIGKTRLLAEYRALAALKGGVTMLLSCQSHDVFRPLGILCDLVSELLEAPGGLGCDPGARLLLERLVSVKKNIDESVEAQTANTPVTAIVRSMIDLVNAVTTECPVTVLIDDAQWMDQISFRSIIAAFSAGGIRRSCVIMSSRNRALLAGADSYSDVVSSIRVNPLHRVAALELSRALLGDIGPTNCEATQEFVVDEANGNPFFIRLLCAHFRSTQDVERLRNTLVEVLERRLQQLSPTTYRVLEGCVILGRNCTSSRLEALLGVSRNELLASLEELDDRGLTHVGDGGLVTSHDLLGGAVVSRMSPAVNRVLHSSAGALLQGEIDSASVGSLPWDCAEHWRRAGNHSQAITVLRRCAQRFIEIGQPNDGIATLMRALELDTEDATRLEIVESIMNSIFFGVDWKEISDLLPERARLRDRLGWGAVVHDSYEILEIATAHHLDADPRVNVERLKACISAPNVDTNHKFAATLQLLIIAELTLDHELAEIAADASQRQDTGHHLQVLSDLLYHTCFGNVERARHLATQVAQFGIRAARQGIIYVLNAGYAQYRVGSPGEAEETLLLGLELAKDSGSLAGHVSALLFLARLCWSTERIEESKRWLEAIGRLQKRNLDVDAEIDAAVLAARIAILEQRYEDARRIINGARVYRRAQLVLPRLLLGACDLHLRLAEVDDHIGDTELSNLMSLYTRARNIGCQDEVTGVIVRALDACGREDQGSALLRDYVTTYRRDGFPVARDLSSRLTAPAR